MLSSTYLTISSICVIISALLGLCFLKASKKKKENESEVDRVNKGVLSKIFIGLAVVLIIIDLASMFL